MTAHAWLALAIAAAALAAVVVAADRLRRRRDEAQAFLKGVRSMISDDPDAAIEALSDAARLGSPEAIDTYLALGALFRRTGDLARAVRLHRNMLFGPGLPEARRAEVERELAEDYRRSGMLADAEEILARHSARGDRAAAAALRDVLSEQGRLAEAAEVQRRIAPPGADPLLAHLLAAHARQEVAARPAGAIAAAREAIEADPASADARLALAEAEAAAGRVAEALEQVGRALDADPRAAVLAWPPLGRLDPGAVRAFVEPRLARAPDDPGLHMLLARSLYRAGRVPEAIPVARRALDLDSSGEVTLAMRELFRAAADPSPEYLAARHEILVLALRRRATPLRCARCGGEAAARAWRCPRCKAFDAFP
ncbi:MAG TPA: tetratricopeptide repeat protein [Anaeromyxobacteraceae bacterium]|nr:tetratricopeptide repeat protein [Anaeromyxobacteraceae bacterium]